MFILNTLVQLVAIIVGIYIAFSDSFGKGVLLVIIVLVMHAVFTQLSNFLMYLHQKTMSETDLQTIVDFSMTGRADAVQPTAWKIIANICGVLFIISASYVIYLFIYGQ